MSVLSKEENTFNYSSPKKDQCHHAQIRQLQYHQLYQQQEQIAKQRE